MQRNIATVAAASAAFLVAAAPRLAAACGCFAAPNPSVPVVQAGEKILFVQEGTNVIAHIQIQYEGEAEEFGWLIPMPSIPDFRLSTEELFAELENATNPTFLYNQVFEACAQADSGGFGCGGDDDSAAAFEGIPTPATPPQSPDPVLVRESTAGPFDFAIVRADNKEPMLQWLRDNRYLVPEGGEDLLDPYIRSGAFFLALKLTSGQSAGDLQPIVIEYEADVPMIPLILTRLGAVQDMGVLVWLLSDSRAVPLNYRHVEINEEYIDWVNGADNYAEVVARAVDEAENGHAFVTEYAGWSEPVVGRLDPPGRFGRRDVFEMTTDAITYIRNLEDNGFPMDALRPIFERVFPIAEAAIQGGISPDAYYRDLAGSLSVYDPNPAGFDPVTLTEEIWERVVEPTIAAGALFRDHPYLTRLYTAISPDEMTADPAFGFNPEIGRVSNQHSATMTRLCEPEDEKYPWRMRLSDGRDYYVEDPSQWATRRTNDAPRTVVIESVGLEGQPMVEVDNRETLQVLSGLPDAGGCRSISRSRLSWIVNFTFLFGSVFLLRRRLRRA